MPSFIAIQMAFFERSPLVTR